MFQNHETKISPTGLRYTSKSNGSPYQGMGGHGETLSCIKCGLHKPRIKGSFKRYLHGLFFFCLECRPRQSNLPTF
jgi:hypothetical protein